MNCDNNPSDYVSSRLSVTIYPSDCAYLTSLTIIFQTLCLGDYLWQQSFKQFTGRLSAAIILQTMCLGDYDNNPSDYVYWSLCVTIILHSFIVCVLEIIYDSNHSDYVSGRLSAAIIL